MNTKTCTIDKGKQTSCAVDCDAGLTVVGGGVESGGDFADDVQVSSSYPSSRTAWTVRMDKQAGSPTDSVTVYVLCATADQVT